MLIFPGEHTYWTLRQAACAMREHGGFMTPSVESMNELQRWWYDRYVDHPPKNADVDLSWAQQAMQTIPTTLKYEACPA